MFPEEFPEHFEYKGNKNNHKERLDILEKKLNKTTERMISQIERIANQTQRMEEILSMHAQQIEFILNHIEDENEMVDKVLLWFMNEVPKRRKSQMKIVVKILAIFGAIFGGFILILEMLL